MNFEKLLSQLGKFSIRPSVRAFFCILYAVFFYTFFQCFERLFFILLANWCQYALFELYKVCDTAILTQRDNEYIRFKFHSFWSHYIYL